MKVVFVCWGNICRSPMAERVARSWVADAGVTAEVTSAGVSSEEIGSPIDRRAAGVLSAAGYDPTGHRAHQISATEIRGADLVIAAEQIHIDRMRLLVPQAQNLYLINDFNPAKPRGSALEDPWYGPESGFEDTLSDIEAAMPGILARIRSKN